jgi:hypothetical protein
MTAGETGGKADDSGARHVYGPRSLAALLPDLMRPALRRRSPAASHLLGEWEAIVGPAISAISQPRRLFAGTLSIAASNTAAMEMQYVSSVLIERINTHLGHKAVSRLRFVQDLPTPPPQPMAVAPPQARAAAAAAVAHLPEGALRDALERLGRSVLARPPGGAA